MKVTKDYLRKLIRESLQEVTDFDFDPEEKYANAVNDLGSALRVCIGMIESSSNAQADKELLMQAKQIIEELEARAESA